MNPLRAFKNLISKIIATIIIIFIFIHISIHIHPYRSSLLVGPLDCIRCQTRAGVCMYIRMFLLFGQHWCVHVLESIEKRHLSVRSNFSSSAQHVLFALLGLVRWEASGRTAAVLWRTFSRICSKQRVAFSYSSLLAFFSIRFIKVKVVQLYISTKLCEWLNCSLSLGVVRRQKQQTNK